MSEQELYVARSDDFETLSNHWNQATEKSAALLLTGTLGSGKRAMVGQLARTINKDGEVLICRPSFSDEEDGQGALVKLYTALFSAIHAKKGFRSTLEINLNLQMSQYDNRIQNWIRMFIDALKSGAPKEDSNEFQVSVPRDNPYLAFIEITHAIAEKVPMLLDLQNLQNVHSLPFYTMLEAVLARTGSEKHSILTILHMVPIEGNESWVALPLQEIISRREDLATLALQPWDVQHTEKYLSSRDMDTSLAEKFVELSSARPGFIAELADWAANDEAFLARLPETTLETIVDFAPSEEMSESSSEPAADSKRKVCTPEESENIAYLGALLGMSFPSGLVADMGNFERNSVDDLLDASEHLYKELQHSKPLNTWVYQFQRAIYREAILAKRTSEDDKKIAANVGVFLERTLAPRGFGYLSKALRIYARSAAPQRASALRNLAMNADNPQLWLCARDIIAAHPQHTWPDAMIRTTLLQLCDRMSSAGKVEDSEKIIQESLQWASSKEDKATRAMVLLSGAKLDRRRQDNYRARDRAKEALNIFRSIENSNQLQGNCLAQLALIELQDKKYNAAMDCARQAEKAAAIPPVQAFCRFVEGAINAEGRKFEQAAKLFEESNRLAGQSGNAMLALDSGIKLGQVLLAGGQTAKAADVLQQVAGIAQQAKAPAQERACTALLAQAHGNEKNFEAALKAANRTLEITKALGFTSLEAIDTYNVGLFNLMLQRKTEAVALFKVAREKLPPQNNPGFLKELLFSLGMTQVQIGENQAGEQNLREALAPAAAVKDWGKVIGTHQQLAELARGRGDKNEAIKHLNQALKVAEQTKNSEIRKKIKDQLKSLR